jgi:hypothetical protein
LNLGHSVPQSVVPESAGCLTLTVLGLYDQSASFCGFADARPGHYGEGHPHHGRVGRKPAARHAR